jgi:hypothetical protein
MKESRHAKEHMRNVILFFDRIKLRFFSMEKNLCKES